MPNKNHLSKSKNVVVSIQTPIQAPIQAPIPELTNSRQALSLFSGAGGDTCGLEQAGWNVTHFSENNDAAIKTHLAAFPSSQLLLGANNSNDIKNIPDSTFEKLRGKTDLIFAGFPCQGFSHAGRKRSEDPRNELVHEFVRATQIIQPTWIIGENVKGLLSRKGVHPVGSQPRPVIEIIRELFETIGYKITYKVIDAIEVGVPQLRKRLIIIGHKGDKYPHILWPSIQAIPKIRPILSSTLEGAMEMPTTLYKCSEQPNRFWIHTTETSPSGTPHPNLVRLVSGIRNLSSKELEEGGYPSKSKIQYTEPNGLISFGVRKSGYHGQILDPDAPSKTIICTYNLCPRLFVGLHNPSTGKYWIRCLTYKECGQIQGFVENYPWQGQTKDKIIQIGNAVPPSLATNIARLLDNSSNSISFKDFPQEVPIIVSSKDSKKSGKSAEGTKGAEVAEDAEDTDED
jgi:DNA (cytosine-5)-methyltransferase 1